MAQDTRKELSNKECKHCTEAFLGRSNKQYCSDQCATAARVNKHRKNKTASGIRKYVRKADKDLFLKLKDGSITLDQLKARIAERKTGLKYVVLDDLKDVLDPKFYEEVYQDKSTK